MDLGLAPTRVARQVRGLGIALALLAPFLSHSQATALPAASAQPLVQPAGPASAPARAASAARSGASAVKPNAKAQVTRPLWRELNAGQQKALAPLAAKWDTLNEPQKRKWLALSANYPKMSVAEQDKLHSRMTEWAALSPQQRAVARLNYGETQNISPDDKKAKWEAYQALSPEEKRKLAAGVAKPPITAAAVRPVPPEKLAAVPKPQPKPTSKTPRIAAAPNQVDHNTLLPQQHPAGGGTH